MLRPAERSLPHRKGDSGPRFVGSPGLVVERVVEGEGFQIQYRRRWMAPSPFTPGGEGQWQDFEPDRILRQSANDRLAGQVAPEGLRLVVEHELVAADRAGLRCRRQFALHRAHACETGLLTGRGSSRNR